jgi:thioredoxin-related protein
MKRIMLMFIWLTLFSFSACGKKDETVKADLNTAIPAQSVQSSITWYDDWDTGMAEAKKAAKPVFVDFYADWCIYCKKMDKETFEAPEIQKRFSSDWIGIKIDTEAHDKTGNVYIDKKDNSSFAYVKDIQGTLEVKTLNNSQLIGFFGGRGIPTLLFIDKDGKVIRSYAGFLPKEQFGPMLDYFRDELYIKNVNIGEYIKSKR